ncbi:diguanylate cyclase [Shewanella mesophila]|uniref:sensor domain-containing diguanylate cyclase n=1 Tax=Shewanella mesophila TaxID=2864208 RepID=UPI001C65DC1C|nr:diguanylate cyclase [Shewanella mesophila]QYJ87022.1 diguanylate cyclase [Shewanella mesophila]
MKLNHFLNLLGLVLLLLSVITASIIYYFVYLPAIAEQVLQKQHKELAVVQKGIEFSQRNLETLCYDYALWDNMVEFVESMSIDFIQSNLMDNTFEAASLDGFYIFDRKGLLKWHYAKNRNYSPQYLPQETAGFIGRILPPADVFLQNKPSVRNGLLNMGSKLVYFSNVTIMPTSGTGDIVGSLLVVRELSGKAEQEIGELSLVNFHITKLDVNFTAPNMLDFRSPPNVVEIASSHAWIIKDVLGFAAAKITVNHAEGQLPSIFTLESLLMFFSVLIMTSIAILPLSWFVLRPLRVVNQVLSKMATKERLLRMPTTWRIDEIANLTLSFNLVVDKLERHQNYLENLSFNDALTGIANRRSLEVFAERAHEHWRAGKGAIGFLMIDIDYFKIYNDSVGHQAGDQVLIRVAQALMVECRRRGELVTRYGGEEFCVVIQGDNTAQMTLLAERLLKRVRALNIYHEQSPLGIITVSIGGVFYPPFHPQFTDVDWQSMIGLADGQLYVSKHAGRNCLNINYQSVNPLMIVG